MPGGAVTDKNQKKKKKAKDDAGQTKPADNASASGSNKLKPAQSINVRHILCQKHAAKEEALEELKGGANFADVAKARSEDKARQGGLLGWKTRGSLLPDFEKVAYDLQPSTPAKPVWGEVKTQEGYHILMVEGRK